MRIGYLLTTLLGISLPGLALAQGVAEDFGYFGNFGVALVDFINVFVIPLILAIIVVVFFWGVFTYFILGGADEGKREQGRSLILYAIIGLVIAVALYGIINIIAGAFGLDAGGELKLPGVPATK